MIKTHNTAVVTIPPESVWPPIQAIRQQHDSKIRRWMPHITLIYPFCPVSDFPAMAELIADQIVNIEPFRVTLSSLDSFTHAKGRCTFWLRPEPVAPLLDLHAAVWTAVSYDKHYQPRIGRFTPHLSVGQVRGKDKRNRLVTELQRDWTPLAFDVTAVHLIARDNPPNDVFQIERTIQLGGRPER